MKNSINFEKLDVMLDNFRSSNVKSTWFVYESENRMTALKRYLKELNSPVSYRAFRHRVIRNVFQYKGFYILTPKEIQYVINKDVSPVTHVEIDDSRVSWNDNVNKEETMKNSINFERLDVMLEDFKSYDRKLIWFVYESENKITPLKIYLEEIKSPVNYQLFLYRARKSAYTCTYKGCNILTPKEVADIINQYALPAFDMVPTYSIGSNIGDVESNDAIGSDIGGVEIEEVITIKRVAKISIDAIRQKFNISDDIEIKIV